MTILAVSDESLLQYGWAPGGYMIRCMDCGGDGLGGNDGCAKRSSRCRACAVKCWERDIAKSPSPMTGDGAVVREWEVMRRLAEAILHNREASFADWLDLARAYLAQAAEQSLGKELSELAQEHAEARTADLLKALERYGHHMVDCKSQRAASRTSASCGPCTCGLAAAKGETV